VGKFNRAYQLQVDTNIGTTIEIDPPFSCEFEVVRSYGGGGHARFRIYNLGTTTRNQLRKDITQSDVFRGIVFRAGYGNTLPDVFIGNLAQGWSVRQGVDMITSLDSMQSAFGIANTESGFTVQSGTTLKSAVAQLLLDLVPNGIKAGKVGEYRDENGQPISFQRATTLSGNTVQLINDLTGGGFFVDNGVAHVLADEEVLQGPLVTLDSSHGLLGTPMLEQNKLNFDILFEPRLQLGQKVTLNSFTAEKFNGDYKVFGLRHRGMISESVCGEAITSVTLWKPDEVLATVV